MSKPKTFLLVVACFILIAQACNLPSNVPVEETLDPLVAAQLTVTAAASPIQIPTDGGQDAAPTFTPLPTLTFTPAFTSTSAFTPTPSYSYVVLSQATNCRTGPAKIYDLVDTFLPGQVIEVTGRNFNGDYWYVRSPNNQTVFCWLWGYYATGGNLGNVVVFTPPASPTPAPSFDASYAGIDSCVGWWVEIALKNTGPVAFKSMSISVKDTVTDITLTDFGDGFEDLSGCLASGIVASLDPGQSYTISSPAFAANPIGHKIKVTVTLCTSIGQGGICVSNSLEFKP